MYTKVNTEIVPNNTHVSKFHHKQQRNARKRICFKVDLDLEGSARNFVCDTSSCYDDNLCQILIQPQTTKLWPGNQCEKPYGRLTFKCQRTPSLNIVKTKPVFLNLFLESMIYRKTYITGNNETISTLECLKV